MKLIIDSIIKTANAVDSYPELLKLNRIIDLVKILSNEYTEQLVEASRQAAARISAQEIKGSKKQGVYRPIDLSRANDPSYNPYAQDRVVKPVAEVKIPEPKQQQEKTKELTYSDLIDKFGSVEALQEFITEKLKRTVTTLNEDKLLAYYLKAIA